MLDWSYNATKDKQIARIPDSGYKKREVDSELGRGCFSSWWYLFQERHRIFPYETLSKTHLSATTRGPPMKIVLLGELNAGKIRFSNHETSWLMGVNFYFSIPDQNQFIIPCCQKPLHTLALCTPHSAGLCSKETSVAKSRKAHSDKKLLQNYYRIIIDLLKNFCMSRKAHSDGLGT